MFQNNLPPQQISFSRKNKEWRKKHLDWADNRSFATDSLVRNSVMHKKINYDLLGGKLNINDLNQVLNPDSIQAGFIPDTISHYPIMNSKLNVLRGEESKRRFDFRMIVTNPNAISEIENKKKELLFEDVKKLISKNGLTDDQFNAELDKINNYYSYEYQDIREIRANALIQHYTKELEIPNTFNAGFVDAMTVGEEIYQCDIVSGEPTFERINPLKIRVFRAGSSNRIEDADIVVLEDFWSPGRIIDTYYDSLSQKDMDYIETMPQASHTDAMGNIDERNAFVNMNDLSGTTAEGVIIDSYALFTGPNMSNNYFDGNGNIKVLRVYWKSRRKIKKVKFYDPETGEQDFKFYPETYIIDKNKGEEEEIYWINEAWEGTKIGPSIYLNMRPRLVQYNRMSNPSRCHFGIVGTLYNLNESRPFSMVDMMKPYNYMYDATHDRLNKAIASNWGKILELDLSLVPKGWEVEKWLYYAKVNHIAVKDSFKEGNVGAATGKLAGSMNNASKGVIDAETGGFIQQHINLLEFIKMEMSEVAGISKQREGQISNRETVGGVERSNLQSSHITEWLFLQHDNTKKRSLECFIETAKIAMKGRSKKFQYILPDYSYRLMDIDGDEFADCDYGCVIDNSNGTQELASKLDSLAQAALQNQTLDFSTIMKIYTNTSLAETQRIVEQNERTMQENRQKSEQAQQQHEQSLEQMRQQNLVEQRQLLDTLNQRDNDYKVMLKKMDIANTSTQEEDSEQESYDPVAQAKLLEDMKQFSMEHGLKVDDLQFKKKVHADNMSLKKEDLSIKRINKNKTSK